MEQARPIGVFDSGLGGLTVARAVRAALPAEHLVYLGDTARVPYGTRSAHTVIRYARSCAAHLQRRGAKLLVVACNTVSAVALDMLRVELDIPVLGVIQPGARAGVEATRSQRLGVIATRGTVASGAYVRATAALDPRVEVFAREAPLFVPLAEEGWVEGPVPEAVARRYLAPFAQEGVDALVLGCTHYPLLRPVIEAVSAELLGPGTRVVDGAEATAAALAALLEDRAMGVEGSERGGMELLVTDLPDRFGEVASRFLGEDVSGLEVEQVDL
ncbi:MAG TPA: glutamate racemase [Polyangiaceae bacterium LLY-WYZ-15_(1-7)]|nr:glutamate racemase [Sandaracinus sp.]HJK91720.1 glutamate racemase [Polyangiaceae bacterium LLY-WYZ-15_(1-7)]MBJ75189.1 glutamate racemase [Sandaracinus sp.]HJL05495.1 glutamate racemase [Polyangiaceae bacterium LLY-WYZ-15_(1-7)]HJL13736.1 glutamate racemase [Polyangiaceae bacterium LLY-WYZ-15_(1-7)]